MGEKGEAIRESNLRPWAEVFPVVATLESAEDHDDDDDDLLWAWCCGLEDMTPHGRMPSFGRKQSPGRMASLRSLGGGDFGLVVKRSGVRIPYLYVRAHGFFRSEPQLTSS